MQFLLAGLAALFVFTLRLPNDLSLWHVVREAAPGGASLRALARVGTMIMFPAALGIAIFLDRATRRGFWLTIVLSFVVIAEQIHAPLVFDKKAMENMVAEISGRLPRKTEAFLLVSTGGESRFDPHDTAAWVAVAAEIPTINGRYGHRPRKWRMRNVDATTPEDIDRITRSLRQWVKRNNLTRPRVVWLSIEPGAIPSRVLGRRQERALDRPPDAPIRKIELPSRTDDAH